MKRQWIILTGILALILAGSFFLRRHNSVKADRAVEVTTTKTDTIPGTKNILDVIRPLTHKIFADARTNTLHLRKYVIGVSLNGESKAYPVQFIAFHHKLRDTVGGVPVLVTYCALCRSGRVYEPKVEGRYTTFRLVGLDNGNSVLEDESTKSQWLQENGESIAGPLRGQSLREVPSHQMTLGSWIHLHPHTYILQRDTEFAADYALLRGYAGGWIKDDRLAENMIPGSASSWIVGVCERGKAKAYDWTALKRRRVINDTIGDVSDVVLLEPDMKSFHAFDRKVGVRVLSFKPSNGDIFIYDTQTHSVWNFYGECTAGRLKGSRMKPLSSYQEFLQSWRIFHPNTTRLAVH